MNSEQTQIVNTGFSWVACSRCKAKQLDPDVSLTPITDSLGVLHLFCEACVTKYNLYLHIPCAHH